MSIVSESSENPLFLEIFAFLANFAFEADFVSELRKTLNNYFEALLKVMKTKPRNEINVVDAYNCAEQILLHNIKSLDSDDANRLLYESLFFLLYTSFFDMRRIKSEDLIHEGDQSYFLHKYPDFAVFEGRINMYPNEMHNLILFRNIIVLALPIIPARGYKHTLLNLATKMSVGKFESYAFQGTPLGFAAKRRIQIYEKEGNITPIKINKKRPHEDINPEGNDLLFEDRSDFPLERIFLDELLLDIPLVEEIKEVLESGDNSVMGLNEGYAEVSVDGDDVGNVLQSTLKSTVGALVKGAEGTSGDDCWDLFTFNDEDIKLYGPEKGY